MTIHTSDLIPITTSRASVGDRFGRLTIRALGRCEKRRYYAVCDCECGTQGRIIQLAKLVSGATVGCGCMSGEHLRTHGQSRHPAFWRWQSMMQRCYSESHPSYRLYGGRGISVCDRWHDPIAFIDDMGASFSEELEIDRINTDGNYEPSNCRWVTKAENRDNRRITHFETYKGERLPLRVWAERLGIPLKLLAKRIYERGWPVERAFETPVLAKSEIGKIANAASQQARAKS